MTTLAVDATHVLIVEAPGAWLTRVAIEREVGRRGWRLAMSPADADAVVIAGTPGPQLAERIESVWEALPGPRSRALVAAHADPSAVWAALDTVAAGLLDTDRQLSDARDRKGFNPEHLSDAGMDMDGGDGDGDGDTEGDDDHDMDMGSDGGDSDMDHDMDMGDDDMDMEMAPSGIPLAEGGDDRDGLEMDVLHVPLGPVLPHWPAGVVLHCTLQGDVVVEAEASLLDESDWAAERLAPSERAAWWCDQLAGLLALAGWADGREGALRVRAALLDEPDAASGIALLDDLQRRLRRARLLRWSLRGIGELRPDDDPTAPPHLYGGVYERMVKLTDRARTELADDASAAPQTSLPVLLAVAERLVVGLELAAARLVVGSLAIGDLGTPDADTADSPASPSAATAPEPSGGHHG